MDKPRKRRLDFLPNRQNRYAIRRFSVGTASILVGATLIFGVHSNEASAATEDTATQESNTSKSDVLGEGTSLAETTSEAPAVEAAPTVETTDATLATEATPSVEKSAVTSAEEVAPQPEITEHELTAEEYYSRYWNSAYSSNSENQVLNEALPVQPADQTPTNKDDIAQQTPPQNENTQANNSPATQSQDPSSQSLSQADKLNEVHNYLTQNTTLSEEKINEKLAHLNIDVEHMSAEDIYLALLKDLANQQNELTPPATTISARNTAYTNDESLTRSANETTFFAVVDTTANNDVVAEKNRVIVADALANSYIRSQTDATNAAHTLSGRAWVVDHGTPATFANGLTPVPEGTKVYMQWIDKDGAVSPVYQANTTNRLSSADGSQVGPGAYAFDLREAWIDAKGTSHRYNATGGQYYRLWIDDFKTADGNTVTMLRQSGGFFPGSYVNSVTNSNLGQFPLIGTNMQRTGIFMSVIPTNGYTTKDNAQWLNDAQGSLSNPAVTASVDDFVSGKVWSETGAGDYANSATGPNFNNGDIAREGYQVVMSSLTQEGATAYKAQVSKLPQAEQVAAAHQLLTEHPEYISATVTGRTDTNGNYTLRFPKGDLNKDYLYGYVLDNQGNLVKGYSSFTSPLFQTPNNNLSFTPQTAPYYRPARNAWVNVNFALVETIETTLEITDFDITTNPAKRGDVAHIDVTSTAISPLPTFVEWRDSKGNVVQKSQQVTTVEAAEAAGTFTIPSDAKSGEIYTAYIVSGGNDIAADSLLVQVNENAITYQPHYIPVNVEPGKTATAPVPLDNSGQTLPSGTTFERGNNVPDWATVNPDGTISVTPGADVPVGQYNVPVVVTYPDSSKETVFATVNVEAPAKLAEQYEPTSATVNKAFGTPTTEQDVTGAVTIPYYPTDEEQPRITVDDSSTLPDGRTEGTVDVPVTVTYPDGTVDHMTVPVTTGKQADNDKYTPEASRLNPPYLTPTTEQDVIGAVTIPNYPTDGEQPRITVDDPSTLPDGHTKGTVDVPVTVTYPDGTVDHITVPVKTGKLADIYQPHYPGVFVEAGKTATAPVPLENSSQPLPAGTIFERGDNVPDWVTVNPDGTIFVAPGADIPVDAYEVLVNVTYSDGSKETVLGYAFVGEPVQLADQYEPTSTVVNKEYGTPTTEQDVTGAVTIPYYPTDEEQPQITVKDSNQLPDGTTLGTHNVPVVVTYPDGTTDELTVPVTVADTIAPEIPHVVDPVFLKDMFGTANPNVSGTAEPNSTVTINFRTGESYTGTADENGRFSIPVPFEVRDQWKIQDGLNYVISTDEAGNSTRNYFVVTDTIKPVVGTLNPITDKDLVITGGNAEPLTNVVIVNKDGDVLFQTETDANGNYSITLTTPINVGTELFAVFLDNTENFANGSYDAENNKIILDQANLVRQIVSDTTASSAPLVNPVTSEDTTVTGTSTPGETITVTFPNGETGTTTVNPDGTWTVDIPTGVDLNGGEVITATSTDESGNTSEPTNVTVTAVQRPDNVVYTPETSGVNHPYGTATTAEDVVGTVTVPNYPTTGDQPKVTVDDPSTLPNGNTEGTVDVPVTVTYPDGTVDHITVPVTTGKQADNDKYTPETSGVNHPYGTETTVDDITNTVTVPNYPTTGEQPKVTVDDPTQLPNGNTEGTVDVPVTVTYPDGTVDHITVPVTTGKQADNDKYTPETSGVEKDYGTATTAEDVVGTVTVPNYPTTGEQPKVTVDDPSTLPNGNTEGTVDVPVTVTYPDGTVDHITVPVTTGKQADNDKYTPETSGVNHPYGTATTAEDVVGTVTVPNYPTTGDQPKVTVDDPTQLPNGNTEGTVDVPVTVTYPDGTVDHITVPVTTGKQADNDKYTPETSGVNHPYGTATTAEDVVGTVTVPNYPTTGEQPKVTVDDPSTLPNGNTEGTVDVPVTVTYPDGTVDHITVPVTTGKQADNDKYTPETSGVNHPYGTETTVDDITNTVTVPNYPTTGEQPKVTVDDPSTLPNGNTEGTVDVPVTVTYPDGTVDHITVPVTTGKQADNDKYTPETNGVNHPYGTATTAEDVIGTVTVSNYPTTGDQPKVTVDDPTQLPNGNTEGTVDVPVTVTYPDGTVDHITVPVTTGKQADNDKYTPETSGVEKDYGTATTAEDVVGTVTVPNYPTTGEQPKVTVDDSSTLPNGNTEGTVDVPVTVTYPDGTVDHITVPVTTGKQADNDKYTPETNGVNHPYGTATTADEITNTVTVPNYPTTGEQPKVTVDDPSTLPNGNTEGTVDVSVTVTYPDGTVDHITVPVTTGKQADNDKYTPETNGVNHPYGTATTAEDVVGTVTVPNYPTTGEQPKVTVDDPSTLPNGNTEGTVDVSVTVTYPDGTVDHITVPVTTGKQADNDKYTPETNGVNHPYGTATTADEITNTVTVPNYPTTGEQPKVTVDDPSTLPNGNTEGTVDMPVTVTYPDGTVDHITVPVTTGKQADNDKYTPETSGVEKEHGTPITVEDIVGTVTVPNYPTTGEQPSVTVDDPSTLPNGNTEGTVDVSVTVTYPDGTVDHITVPVTTGKQADNDKYTPETNGVNHPYGTATTAEDVVGTVTVPNYPTTGEQPKVTVDDPSTLPNGNTEGTVDVSVTVTYPDGTVDHITVPVTTGKQADNDKYTPETNGVNHPYGTATTADEITNTVTVPNYPTTGEQPKVTVDDPSTLPNGNTEGTVDVPVTVTYPDGTVDHITVPVTTGKQADNDKYTPETSGVEKEHGTPITVEDIVGTVTVPNYPTTGEQPSVTVDDPTQLPDGNTEGTVDVPVTVTYPDGTVDHITVPVTTSKQADNDKYTPETNGVEKEHGTPITVEDVVGTVTVPNYPTTGDQPKVTVDDPSTLPNGNTEGTVDVPVTVTYPDGTVDHITVPVTTGKQADNDKYTPETSGIEKEHGTPITVEDVVGTVTVPNYPTTGDQPKVTVDDPSTLPNGNTEGTVDVPVTVTYPDGTVDHITVPVTTGKQADNDKYTPETNGVNHPYGTATTADEITNTVTVPNYPTTGEQPKVTVDDPSTLPNGNTEGTVDVPVIVTYPDGTVDHITVPVTTSKQADNDKYTPETNGVEKEHGTPITVEDVVGTVTVPNYPTTGDQPKVTVDDPSTLPNGNTEGTVDVPVTVTYPDGTVDHITVPVTTSKQADNDKYTPETNGVEKEHGTPITVEDVLGTVTVPNYPTTGEQPKVTVDDPSTLPNGNTEGTVDVPVTVTYPDGTVDHITVPVTTSKQADNDKYTPETNGVEKEHGTPITVEDVVGTVTVPNYPTTGDQPKVTVDDPSTLPNGNTEGTVDVPVTVTYPDGTVDHITVPVTTGKQADNDKYTPETSGIEKEHGTPITVEDVVGTVTVPNYPTTGDQPKVTVDDPSTLPNGNTEGTVDVSVTVTYPDGTVDHITVPVTTSKQADNDKYTPETNGVEKEHGTPITVEDIVGTVTVPNYPTTGEQPKVTVEDPSTLPNGNTEGTVDVPVTVTYPDGTVDHITVPVTTGKQADNDKYTPETNGVEKEHGTPITVEDIVGTVTVPNYPTTGDQPKVTVDDPSTLPNGNTEGTVDVPVTVTYPDGTVDHITVPVTTVGDTSSQADKNYPSYEETHVSPGTTVHVNQTGDNTMPDGTHYEIGKDIPKGWTVSVDPNSGMVSITPPQNAKVGEIVRIPIVVVYPDGSMEMLSVTVIVDGKDNGTSKPIVKTPIKDNVMPSGDSHTAVGSNGTKSTMMSDMKPTLKSEMVSMHNNQDAMNQPMPHSTETLPDTGETDYSNGALLGGLFATLGGLFLIGRRRKDNEEK